MGRNPYPTLLSPLTVGTQQLRNRVLMGSMHTRLETLDRSVERRVAFYAARAQGGAALLVTAGYSPNKEGRLEEDAQVFDSPKQIAEHAPVTDAVHRNGANMLLQILHAGRYAKHDQLVGPSALPSPINRRVPREMSEDDIERTIDDFVRSSKLAREAGYDGVEVMGSEGYLLTQFSALRSNHRSDRWGGSLENRCRLALEIVRRIRTRLGIDFMISYRLSAIDLVADGLTADEIDYLARELETAGASMLVTGIGWHESPVPTIAYHVPRAAWAFAAARLKRVVRIPVVATNRINTPEVAEHLIASGAADLVALARPLLADPDFVSKAATGRSTEIAPCIACNQACLDDIFTDRVASCLVNPRAGREQEFNLPPPLTPLRIAIIGAGPAGLSCAIAAADRGHAVTLFDAADEIGGQLHLARRIPGKQEFNELLRYYRAQLVSRPIGLELGRRVVASSLLGAGFDQVVVATGAVARRPDIPGIEGPNVVSYRDAILERHVLGQRIAIIGTGGIGHDVAALLVENPQEETTAQFFAEWGVDPNITGAGGLRAIAQPHRTRTFTLLQRSAARARSRLGVSTGWILRSKLKSRGVEFLSGCTYTHFDGRGVHYLANGAACLAEADTVIICAGQEPEQALAGELRALNVPHTCVGGARLATELDATRELRSQTKVRPGSMAIFSGSCANTNNVHIIEC